MSSSMQTAMADENRRNTQIEERRRISNRQIRNNQQLLSIKWKHFNVDYQFEIDTTNSINIYQLLIDKILTIVPDFNNLIATKMLNGDEVIIASDDELRHMISSNNSEHLLIHTVTIGTTTSNTSTALSRNTESATTELPPSYDEAIKRTSSIVPQQKLVDSERIKQQQIRQQQLTYPQYNEATLPYPRINQLPQPQQQQLYPQHQPTAYSVQQPIIPQQPMMSQQPQWPYPVGYIPPQPAQPPQPVSYVYPNYAFGNYWSGSGCYNGYGGYYDGGCGGGHCC